MGSSRDNELSVVINWSRAMDLLLLLFLASACTAQELTSIQSKLEHVVYLYPNQIRKESDLPECGTVEVCSTEHRRYWLPTWVHRFCRCPTTDCSESVSMLDNRSNIKVCKSEVEKLTTCSEREAGLETIKIDGSRQKIKISCICSWPKYWALAGRVENATLTHDRYACQSLKRCESGEFCGHIRADTYSMYLQCSCPQQHICLNKDRTERTVSEALFNGPAIRAYCLPQKNNTQ